MEETHRQLGVVSSDLYDLKQRLSKLKGSMGIINVGGNSTLEKTSNFDLVEDAVKACESAYNYGYNIGGNLIIPICINELLNDPYSGFSKDEINMMNLLGNAFAQVFYKVIGNKYSIDSVETHNMISDIIHKCITTKKCYNLITDTYSDDVINSCFTDIEILKAATSIVALLIQVINIFQ
jgi:chaperonin GroEL (HSP60 family)